MISFKIKYLPLVVMIIILSCERDVNDVKLPEFKQKLVITSFISPSDSVSYFLVTSNKKIYGELNTEEPLGTMKGYLSNGTSEVALDEIGNGFMLTREKMAVEYGRTYRLKISTERGLSSEAACTVPPERNFNIKADTFSVVHQSPGPVVYTFRSTEFALTITDIAGEENFYRISGRIIDYFTDPFSGTTYEIINDPGFEEEYFTDEGMDGKEIIQKTNISSSAHYYSRDSTFLEIALFNTEKSYYMYHRSLDNYNDGENPFTEVTPVYSNVSGGLGVFTSYAVDSFIFRIK
jgi:hypothetical protein